MATPLLGSCCLIPTYIVYTQKVRRRPIRDGLGAVLGDVLTCCLSCPKYGSDLTVLAGIIQSCLKLLLLTSHLSNAKKTESSPSLTLTRVLRERVAKEIGSWVLVTTYIDELPPIPYLIGMRYVKLLVLLEMVAKDRGYLVSHTGKKKFMMY